MPYGYYPLKGERRYSISEFERARRVEAQFEPQILTPLLIYS